MDYKKQKLNCCICGQIFESDFQTNGGFCCSWGCRQEYNWRSTLYIIGEEYRPKEEE